MKKIKIKVYETELVNGNKGKIFIPESASMHELINNQEFLEDVYSGECIRSSAVIKWVLVGYEDVFIDELNNF